jgi:two-component system, OmpR family, response regulator TrcR
VTQAGHDAGVHRSVPLPAVRLAHGPLAHGSLILVICEQDRQIQTHVREAVEGLDVELVLCADGARALLEVGARRADLLVLPAVTQLVATADVVATLRQISSVPIIIGVGPGQADTSGIALAAGANRLLRHPYRQADLRNAIREQLGARLRPAALRRGTLHVNPLAYEVTLAGRPVPMSAHDLEVLLYLMRHCDRAVDGQELREQLWPQGLSPETKAITSAMLRIRTRLAAAGATQEIIRTVRGHGYRLQPPH